MHLPCTRARSAPFEIDFSSVTFYFTVRSPLLRAWRSLLLSAVPTMNCLVLPASEHSCRLTQQSGATPRKCTVSMCEQQQSLEAVPAWSIGTVKHITLHGRRFIELKSVVAERSTVWASALCRITDLGGSG